MKIITAEMIAKLLSRAAASPRKRMNLNLHAEPTDPIGRFLNAGIAGTYVRPHRHRIGRWELVSVLQGRFDLVIFTSDGVVESRVALGAGGSSVAEIPGGVWHSVVFHAPAAVVLEVKAGPYEPRLDKEMAGCAPPEDDPAAALFVTRLETAAPGERVGGKSIMCKTVRGLGLTTALVVFTLSGPAVAQPAVSAPTLVTVDSGSLLGMATGDVISFKGIPYAAPPVGALRWRAPQPLTPWKAVRAAGQFGPSCMQPGNVPKSEDSFSQRPPSYPMPPYPKP
jgi:cupin fold WbuC family metalloprotein